MTNALRPALLVLLASTGLSPCVAGDEKPYHAVVKPGGAQVLAGAGPHYYQTAELPEGSQVEVYQHSDSGYCAIRPPEGSFSWVPASAVQMLEDGVGEVVRDNAPSRVGSLLHQRRDAVHVRLNKGERVRVLAQTEIENVGWLQIAPPAGEFRWVSAGRLSRVTEPKRGEADSGWVQTASHQTAEPTTTPTNQARAQANQASPDAQAEVTGVKPQTGAPAADAAPVVTGDFGVRLAELEVELARQVAEIPTLWRLDLVEQQAAALLSEARTEPQRQAVRQLAARVDRFAKVAARYRTIRSTPPSVRLTKSTIGAASAVSPAPNGAPTGAGAYDAMGTLRPVVSKRPAAPQYALVDAEGKIVSFVTASPEMNLGPLIGKRVGVSGQRGFMPEYQQQHLTASRVTPVDTMLR